MKWIDLSNYKASLSFRETNTTKWFIISPVEAKIDNDLRARIISTVKPADLRLQGEMMAFPISGLTTGVLSGLPKASIVESPRDEVDFEKGVRNEQRVLRDATAKPSANSEARKVRDTASGGQARDDNREGNSEPSGDNGSTSIAPSSVKTHENIHEATTGRELGETSSRRRASPHGKTPDRELLNPDHFYITDELDREGDGFKPMVRFTENESAISLFKSLEGSATAADKKVLTKFNGWGGLARVLDNSHWRESGWIKEAAIKLQGAYDVKDDPLLSRDELESARSATLNSHFTSPDVVEAIWTIVKESGFSGGRILEPAAGIGTFLGKAPRDIVQSSHFTAIEKDALTGGILKTIYPNADVHVGGFEDLKHSNRYDLVITNVPFGDYAVYDKDYRYLNLNIHDYFIVKSLDAAKPGGIVTVITSRFTMDKKDSFARKQMAQRGDLLGAIRLPETAQQAQAGVKVVTDILFFKRHEQPLATLPDASLYSWIASEKYNGERPSWLQTDDDVRINSYFVDNPRQIIGDVGYTRIQNGIPSLGVSSSMSSKVLGKEIVAIAPVFSSNSSLLDNDTSNISSNDERPLELTGQAVGSLINVEGDVHVVLTPDTSTSGGLSGIRLKRVLGMISIKEAMNLVVHHQIDLNSTEDELKGAMASLNHTYDAFINEYGAINLPANARLFVGDPESGRLFALEHFDAETKDAIKADIFSRRIISPQIEVDSFDNNVDALNYVVAQFGAIDIKRVAQLVGSDAGEVASDLLEHNHMYINPGTGKYEIPSRYLSGNVREKLLLAEQSLDDGSLKMAANIKSLKEIVPEDVLFEDITIRPGAGWIEHDLYRSYLAEKFNSYAAINIEDFDVDVRLSDGQWYVNYPRHLKNSSVARGDFGTKRIDMFTLFERIMNQREIIVRDSVKTEKGTSSVVNETETLFAQEKSDLLVDDFIDWIQSDLHRKKEVTDSYNFKMNGFVAPKYNGEHLVFPGMSSAIELRPTQKNAVMRSIHNGNILLAHEVGTGKTYTMIAAAMEFKRLGIASKPLIVVPNHMLEQIHREGLQLYPNAKVLAVTNADLNGDKRKLFVGKVANNDWDFVVMTHSMFGRIAVDPAFERRFITNEIAILRSELNVMDDNGAPKYSLKNVSKKIERRVETLRRLTDVERDDGITMDMLGHDFIAVDEAHNFKNLEIAASDYSLSLAGSNRAFDLYMKLNALREFRNDNKGALFATGTPVSNNLLEIFNMQRYLQPEILESIGIANITSWAASFLSPRTQWEPDASGSGFSLRTRRVLNNIPELMRTWRQVMDVVTAADAGVNRPESEMINVSAPMTNVQETIMANLAERAVAIRGGDVDPRDDNILKIVSEGRQSALDPRLVDPSFSGPAPTDTTKIDMAIENMVEIYHRSDKDLGVQLAFIDMGTPGRQGFNIYDLVKDGLIDAGIPEQEIAYIHGAKNDKAKALLFAKVRSGEVRFLLGSTGKMGEGMNAQDRLIALHDIDPPWRPSDIEQRHGRMVRHGNMFKDVGIYIYTTEGSFDLYMWNTLKVKADAFSRILSGDESLRVFDAQVDPSYADTVAITTNNPLIKDKMEAEAAVSRLQTLSTGYERNLASDKREITYLETQKEEYFLSISKTKELPDPVLNDSGDVLWRFFNIEFFKDDRKEDVAEYTTGTRQQMVQAIESLRKDELVNLEAGTTVFVGDEAVIASRRKGMLTTEWKLNDRIFNGTAAIDNKLKNKESNVESDLRAIERTDTNIEELQVKVKIPNPYKERLHNAEVKLEAVDVAIAAETEGDIKNEQSSSLSH
jgi:N12 class adenine-specific DNA methylase